MSRLHSCTIHEFPLPDRAYYAAAPARWKTPAVSKRRPAPSRGRRRQRSLLPFLTLLGLALFAGGFLLGRAGATGNSASSPATLSNQPFAFLPEEPEPKGSDPVRILSVPGAVHSGKEGQTAGEENWALILISKEHPLPENFQPPELTQLRNSHAIDSRVYPSLQKMMDACRAEGLEPLICSSYRTWETQSELFENKVQSCLPKAGSRQEAEELAAQWVARPGTSEHQAGLAVDIVDKSYQLLDEGQEKTAVQNWLMEHCADYGFILRYPTEKSAITGVGYEPWHYRYVGEAAAQAIMSEGLCLEEYRKDG
ncbi:MAG: M15 family metallopeptidase [Dysosmobacter sp.]|mgnify:CR=1 FL=1|nr:M15 family metallopeptidase [Dysosmobacter sp.]